MTADTCRSPSSCPVPDPATLDLRKLSLSRIPAGSVWWNVCAASYEDDTFNSSGLGNTRFAPIETVTGSNVGSVYLGGSQVAAFLETVLHDVDLTSPSRFVEVAELTNLKMRRFELVSDLSVFDVSTVTKQGFDPSAIVHCEPVHYPCTREWADRLFRWGRRPDGLLWQSRRASYAGPFSPVMSEIAGSSLTRTLVVYERRRLSFTIDVADETLESDSSRGLLLEILDLLDVPLLA